MAAFDRYERFQNIRAGLGFPLENSPNTDQVVRAQFSSEQFVNLKLTNTRQPWSLIETTLETVVGTREYTIANPAAANQLAGKLYFATRVTGLDENSEIAIGVEDFSQATFEQLTDVNETTHAPEKISVYRTNLQNQALKVIVSPTPQEVLTYKLRFYAGIIDRAQIAMNQAAQTPEIIDYFDHLSMLALIRHCKWKGHDFRENKERRAEYRSDIQAELIRLEQLVDEYIDQINSPVSETIGTWRNR